MITRVLDADGNVLHDCEQSNCTVSWDGEDIVRDTTPTPADASPDKTEWDIRGDTAHLRAKPKP